MKHIADRGYTDVTLNKHIDKDAVLEEEYEKAGVELTEERKKYLVEERKLYISVEEVNEKDIKDITLVDEIPEGETVVDRVDIVEEETKEVEEDKTEDVESKANITNEIEDTNQEEPTEEATEDKEEKEHKDNTKNETKNTKKNTQK